MKKTKVMTGTKTTHQTVTINGTALEQVEYYIGLNLGQRFRLILPYHAKGSIDQKVLFEL